MPLFASVTDPIVQLAVNIIADLGLAGIFVLMCLESALVPIPSEAIMLFAGFNVARGEYSLLAITVIGACANLVGSWVAYLIGYYGRIDLLERHGGKLHISQRHLQRADNWFARYGTATVFFARMVPLVRTFISLPAGVAKMSFWRFSVLTLAGCVPWVLALGIIGQQTGQNWQHWRGYLSYVDYVVVLAVVACIAWLIVRRRRNKSQTQQHDEEGPSDGRATETIS
jgi:membrane protein DedA with SNARE-associated domain